MEIYGYQKSGDDLLELKEMSLLCTIEELGKVIDFLEEVKKTHTMVRDKTDICVVYNGKKESLILLLLPKII